MIAALIQKDGVLVGLKEVHDDCIQIQNRIIEENYNKTVSVVIFNKEDNYPKVSGFARLNDNQPVVAFVEQ